MITLTDEERQKCAAYLRQQADTNRAMTKKMKELNSPDFVIRKYDIDAALMVHVADLLINVESMTLKGEE